MSKTKTIWKTKTVGNRRMMICQNSDPKRSKYPEWGPPTGVCDSWSEVGATTTAVTCHYCTQRSVNM